MSKGRLRQNCLSGSARAKVNRIVGDLKRHKLHTPLPKTGQAVFARWIHVCQSGRRKGAA